MPPEVTKPLEEVLGAAMWLVCLTAVVRLIWIGGEMGWHRGSFGDGDAPDHPLWVLIGLVVAAAGGGIAAALLSF